MMDDLNPLRDAITVTFSLSHNGAQLVGPEAPKQLKLLKEFYSIPILEAEER